MCGTSDGRVKFMLNDKGFRIKKAYPGQAVIVSGFKDFPDVGHPLYVVNNPDEATFIIN